MKHSFIIIICTYLILGCANQQEKQKEQKPPEVILAEIDGSPSSLIGIANNLDACSDYYKEDRLSIAKITANAKDLAKRELNILVSCEELLEVASFVLPEKYRNKTMNCSEILSMYLALRKNGMDHYNAESGLQKLLEKTSQW